MADPSLGSSSPAPPADSSSQPTPQVKGLRIMAARTLPVSALMKSLSALSFLRLAQDASDPETVLALNIESRDISKNPYLFSICYFRPQAIDLLYTQLPTSSPRQRRLDMVKYLLNLLTIAEEAYHVDNKHLFQLTEGALSDMNEYVSMDYQKLFSAYDALKGSVGEGQKRIRELSDTNSQLAKDNYDLKNRLDELTLRLQQVERYSDAVLSVKIQQWLSEHNGEINLSEFSRVHGVSEARVEQVLNQLVSDGYLETRK